MNKAEHIARRILESAGYEVLWNGWPDFLAISHSDRVIAVEVKNMLTNDIVRPNQRAMALGLEEADVPVFTAHIIPELMLGKQILGGVTKTAHDSHTETPSCRALFEELQTSFVQELERTRAA
jgi:hypothetical protein